MAARETYAQSDTGAPAKTQGSPVLLRHISVVVFVEMLVELLLLKSLAIYSCHSRG